MFRDSGEYHTDGSDVLAYHCSLGEPGDFGLTKVGTKVEISGWYIFSYHFFLDAYFFVNEGLSNIPMHNWISSDQKTVCRFFVFVVGNCSLDPLNWCAWDPTLESTRARMCSLREYRFASAFPQNFFSLPSLEMLFPWNHRKLTWFLRCSAQWKRGSAKQRPTFPRLFRVPANVFKIVIHLILRWNSNISLGLYRWVYLQCYSTFN